MSLKATKRYSNVLTIRGMQIRITWTPFLNLSDGNFPRCDEMLYGRLLWRISCSHTFQVRAKGYNPYEGNWVMSGKITYMFTLWPRNPTSENRFHRILAKKKKDVRTRLLNAIPFMIAKTVNTRMSLKGTGWRKLGTSPKFYGVLCISEEDWGRSILLKYVTYVTFLLKTLTFKAEIPLSSPPRAFTSSSLFLLPWLPYLSWTMPGTLWPQGLWLAIPLAWNMLPLDVLVAYPLFFKYLLKY